MNSIQYDTQLSSFERMRVAQRKNVSVKSFRIGINLFKVLTCRRETSLCILKILRVVCVGNINIFTLFLISLTCFFFRIKNIYKSLSCIFFFMENSEFEFALVLGVNK